APPARRRPALSRVALAGGGRRGGVLRADRGLDGGGLELPRLVVVLAGHGVLELAHALAERASDLRQALRTEEQQRNQEQKDDLAGSDIRHCKEDSAFGPTVRGRPRANAKEAAG